jgi:hypothetical protein
MNRVGYDLDLGKVFFLVWNPGGDAPRVCHAHESDACAEAQRLAAANPGDCFYVLKAMQRFEKPNVHHTILQER